MASTTKARLSSMRKDHDRDDTGAIPPKEKSYDKACTVEVDIIGDQELSVLEILRGIEQAGGTVLGCRRKGTRKYEITMSHICGKERLMDGLRIGSNTVHVKEISSDEMKVSFMSLPVYISDSEILNKLRGWEVEAVGPIRRRMWPKTDVADGTRICKVRFTDKVRSLPYSAKFETMEGAQYFRVIHDKQAAVCRQCLQPGHIVRECPEFKCRRCNERGHYARECIGKAGPACKGCGERSFRCRCSGPKGGEQDGGIADQREEAEVVIEETVVEEEVEAEDEEQGDKDEEDGESGGNTAEDEGELGPSLDNVDLEGLMANEKEPESTREEADTAPSEKGAATAQGGIIPNTGSEGVAEKGETSKRKESNGDGDGATDGIVKERIGETGWRQATSKKKKLTES
ncbi:uncharacterized protein LOC114837325 [Esox lucius]|uniref:uncharacterized protein LOC114837325 n=1 Tax=Esox lucius TaxID=8010 RepID=UPI0010BE189D|nr:uncharacterized protein LOC114837325 [Esox lucius]